MSGWGNAVSPSACRTAPSKTVVVGERVKRLEPLQVVVRREVILVALAQRHAHRHGVRELVAAGDPPVLGQDLEDLMAQREDAIAIDQASEVEVALGLESRAQRLAVCEQVVGRRHVGEGPVVVHPEATSRSRFSHGKGSAGTARPRNVHSGSQSPSAGRNARRSVGPAREVGTNHRLVAPVLDRPGVEVHDEELPVVLAGLFPLLVALDMPAAAVEPLIHVAQREDELRTWVLQVGEVEVIGDRHHIADRVGFRVEVPEHRHAVVHRTQHAFVGLEAAPVQAAIAEQLERPVQGGGPGLVQPDAEDLWSAHVCGSFTRFRKPPGLKVSAYRSGARSRSNSPLSTSRLAASRGPGPKPVHTGWPFRIVSSKTT